MSTIQRFKTIKENGVFQDYLWPDGLPEFQDYNLIYGWNGTGKTTLAEILRSLEPRKSKPSGAFSLKTDSGVLHSSDLPLERAYGIRVFTKSFVADNVFTASGRVNPILFLGQERIAQKQELDGLTEELSSADKALLDASSDFDTAEKAYEQHCSRLAKEIKQRLSTHRSYIGYDKVRYKRCIEELRNSQDDNNLLSDKELNRLESETRAIRKDDLARVVLDLPPTLKLEKDAVVLLERRVSAKVIQKLENDPGLNSWMKAGLELHRQKDSRECLFCNQELPLDRIGHLEAHFSNDYEELVQELKRELEPFRHYIEVAGSLSLPDKGDFYENLQEEYGKAREGLVDACSRYRQRLQEISTALETKKANPFTQPGLAAASPEPSISTKLDAVNEVIQRHNKRTRTLEHSILKAHEGIEKHLVTESLRDLQQLETAVSEAHSRLGKQQAAQKELQGKVSNSKRRLVDHGRAAESLNRSLLAYLGRDEIRFEIEGGGYRVLRHGKPASRLSEGEETAIALLYFLESLRDQDFDFENGIVVLDDPVSSLDQTALFNAFAFIQERTRGAGQLFILTHNFSFFRQVRNWFEHIKRRPRWGRSVGLYSIRCAQIDGRRVSGLFELDPLLRRFHTEYHYLFHLVHETAHSSGAAADFYHVPNIARRLLEGFLAFRRPRMREGLYAALEESDFSREKLSRIRRFVDTHSHGESLDASTDQDLTILAETPAVMQDVLDFIRHEAETHFGEMEKLLSEE